jgi:hypothetical protein
MSNPVDQWLANIMNLPDLPETDRLIFARIRKKANKMVNDGYDPYDVIVDIFQNAINLMNKGNKN